MKILELVLAPKLGGAHTLARELAAEWRAAGHEVYFLSLDGPLVVGYSVKPEELFGSTVTIAQKGRHTRFPVQQLSRLVGLRRYLSRNRPDLIHSHSLVPNLYGRIGALLKRRTIPVVTTLHAAANADYSNYLVRITENLLTRSTSAVVAVNDEIAAEHRRIFPGRSSKVVVIPNGIAFPTERRERVIQSRPTKFLATSRISRLKDIATMIRGFDGFARSADDVELVVAGPFDDPAYESEILHVHRQLPSRERIRLIGPRANVTDLIRWADAFLHTAVWEGHPLSILEAAAAGVPIVATEIPGIRWCLGPNAEYFSPGNHEELTTALFRLREHWPMVADRARLAAADVRNRYSIVNCSQAYMDLFSQILNPFSTHLAFRQES